MRNQGRATLSASKLGHRRAPRQATSNRVCDYDGCEVLLSRYNLRSQCHGHWATTYPRQRGVETPNAA